MSRCSCYIITHVACGWLCFFLRRANTPRPAVQQLCGLRKNVVSCNTQIGITVGCVSHPVLPTSSSDSVVAGWAGFSLHSADQWGLLAYPHLWSVGFDRWGLGLVSWTDPPWGCSITPPATQQHICLWRAGKQDCPSVLITKLGKVPLFLHNRALLMPALEKGCSCLWRSAGEYLHRSCYRFAACSCSAWMCLTCRGQRIIFLLSFQLFLLI